MTIEAVARSRTLRRDIELRLVGNPCIDELGADGVLLNVATLEKVEAVLAGWRNLR